MDKKTQKNLWTTQKSIQQIQEAIDNLKNSNFSTYITKNNPSHPEDVSLMLKTIEDAQKHLQKAYIEFSSQYF